MSIDFGWNKNDDIYVNPLRSIRSISPHITSMKSGAEMWRIGFRQNSSDRIPPINIGSFDLFNRGMSDFSNKRASLHVAAKSESENPEGDSIKKMLGARIIMKLIQLGANSIILNQVNSNHINTESNHVNLNHSKSDQLIPDD